MVQKPEIMIRNTKNLKSLMAVNILRNILPMALLNPVSLASWVGSV